MSETGAPRSSAHSRAVILIIVAVVFAALVGVKIGGSRSPFPGGAPNTAGASGPTTTRESVDAVASYESALANGKPVFLSFGKTNCPNCAAMTAIVGKVMPEYADDVVYIKALVDEPSGQQLASRFSFQYIPASFFVMPDGAIADSYVGVMDEKQMRGYLDVLVTK